MMGLAALWEELKPVADHDGMEQQVSSSTRPLWHVIRMITSESLDDIISVMERTQISLEPAQAGLLRRLARERGVSMAHLIRDAVDVTYGSAIAPPTREERWERALSSVGSGMGDGSPVATEHDRSLGDIFTE